MLVYTVLYCIIVAKLFNKLYSILQFLLYNCYNALFLLVMLHNLCNYSDQTSRFHLDCQGMRVAVKVQGGVYSLTLKCQGIAIF